MIQAINIATQKCGSKMRFHTFELLPQHLKCRWIRNSADEWKCGSNLCKNLSGLFYFPRIIRHQ